MALTRAPDGLLGRRPALDIRRIVEAHQVGRPLVRPDPQLPAVAAQARVGRTLRERGLVGEGRAEQPGELAARTLWPLRTRRRPVTCYEEPHRRPSRSRGSQGAPASAWTAKASEPPGPLLRWTRTGRGERARARNCYRVESRSLEQKVNGSSHQELPANGRFSDAPAADFFAGYPLGTRRRRRTSQLRKQKRPANAGLLESG